MFAIWPATWPVPGYVADAGICSRAAGCSALGYPAAGLRGQAGLPSVMSLGTYAQGTVLQESIFAGAGRQSHAELVVLARDAQALPLMPEMRALPARISMSCLAYSLTVTVT